MPLDLKLLSKATLETETLVQVFTEVDFRRSSINLVLLKRCVAVLAAVYKCRL